MGNRDEPKGLKTYLCIFLKKHSNVINFFAGNILNELKPGTKSQRKAYLKSSVVGMIIVIKLQICLVKYASCSGLLNESNYRPVTNNIALVYTTQNCLAS